MANGIKEYDDQDTKYNPAEALSAGEQAALDQIEASLKDDGFTGLDENPSDKVAQKETETNNPMGYTTAGKQAANKATAGKFLAFAKKRGGIIGLLSIFGISGGILAGFFGPATMLTSLTDNLTLHNDSSGTSMSARVDKVLARLTKPGDDGGVCSSTKSTIKCKNGRISNKALIKLNSTSGIRAYSGDPSKGGKLIDTKDGKYPKKNPTHYEIDLDDGSGKKSVVAAGDLMEFLNKNPKLRGKVLGIRGAFNARYMAWSGNIIKNSFFGKFGISKNGGMADGKTSKFANTEEKIKSAQDKLKKRIPGLDKLNNFRDQMNTKVSGKMTRAKAGGVAYQTAFAGCLISKAPSLISAGVAGVQLLRLVPLINDGILSPGSKQKAGDMIGEEADVIGTMLTQTTENSEGRLTSALDSAAFQSAIGINSNKLSLSNLKDFIPGYSILTSDAMTFARDAQKTVAPACNVILNPVTMYAFMAAEAVITKTNIVGLAAGLVGSVVVGYAAEPLVEWALSSAGEAIINKLAESDALDNLEGEQLGDALGVAAMAFYSAGSMSRFVPTLTEANLVSYEKVKESVAESEREMDIATLSPFDTSSRHTFLGSISHRIGLTLISNGGIRNTSSLLSSILSLPKLALLPNASAANYSVTYCGYADSFGLTVDKTTDQNADNPAINAAGLPCTGLTQDQAIMGSEEAENLLVQSGWLDNTIEVEDGASIQELLDAGVIVQDSPLGAYVQGCGDASTGDYLYEIQGCVVKSSFTTGGSYVGDSSGVPEMCEESGEDGGETYCVDEYESAGKSMDESYAQMAMAVWLIDYQISLSINGEDEEEFSSNAQSDQSATESIDTPSKEGWSNPMTVPAGFGYHVPSSQPSKKGQLHKGIDFPAPKGTPVYAAHDGTVTRSWYMGSCGSATVITAEGVPGIWHAYQHMDPSVKLGNVVKRGDKIGVVGKFCGTGTHLHFSIETSNRVSSYADSGSNDTSKNPALYIPLSGGGS